MSEQATEQTQANPTPESAATPAPAADAPKPAESAPEAKPAAEPKQADQAAPEKFELKLPEGSKLAAEHVQKVEAFAKEKGLSAVQAQAILDRENEQATAHEKALLDAFDSKASQWKTEIQNDKELGGDNYTKSVEIAHRGLKKFATPEFVQELEKTGLGNHPEMVRTFYKIGKEMANDELHHSNTNNATEVRGADVLFGAPKK